MTSINGTLNVSVYPPFCVPEVTGADQSGAPLDVVRRERTAPTMRLDSSIPGPSARLYSSIDPTHFGAPRSKYAHQFVDVPEWHSSPLVYVGELLVLPS